jgi:hypothetical protein
MIRKPRRSIAPFRKAQPTRSTNGGEKKKEKGRMWKATILTVLGITAICSVFVKTSICIFPSNPDSKKSLATKSSSSLLGAIRARSAHSMSKSFEIPLLPLPKKSEILVPTVSRNMNQPSLAVNRNRTLVVLIGDLRCGETAWRSLYMNVLDANQADLALFVQIPDQVEYSNASLFTRAKHIEWIPRYDDWADAIDLIGGSEWRKAAFEFYPSSIYPLILGGVKGYDASAAMVHMFRWFVAQRIQKDGWEQTYDRFIITRTDQFYKCPLKLSELPSERIWLSEGENYWGFNDRFYTAPSSLILKTLDVMPTFLRHPDMFVNVTPKENMNSEIFLKTTWTKLGLVPLIGRFRRILFTCSIPVDTTRWSTGKELAPEGVLLKYPDEYKVATASCERLSNGNVPLVPKRYMNIV